MSPPTIYTKRELREKRRKANEARDQRLRDQYGVNTLNQMQALSIKGMHAWLLQGPKLVKMGLLIEDIFFKISSYVCKLPIRETQYIYLAVHKQLFKEMVNRINKNNRKWFGLFKNETKAEAKRKVAAIRYDHRKKFGYS